MSIQVWHANNQTFVVPKDFRASVTTIMRDYKLVATVETDSLSKAYELTNTIESLWWENMGVNFFGSRDHGMEWARSTSVGDILIIETETGYRSYVVASVGFMEFDR
jgi:hypothetical protein